MLENFDKIMHLRFKFHACPVHSPFRFVHLTHQNLSARALFCHNSLPEVNTQLLIYNSKKCYAYAVTHTVAKVCLPLDLLLHELSVNNVQEIVANFRGNLWWGHTQLCFNILFQRFTVQGAIQ